MVIARQCTRTHIFPDSFVSRGGVLELRRVGGRRILVGPDVIRVCRRKQWYYGPFNPSSTPRDANSLPPLGEGFNSDWVPAGRVRGRMNITGWDRRLGLLLASRNGVFAEHRRASITRPTGCYRDDSYTSHVQHLHTIIIDALDASDRENREASGGKTHR